MSIWNESLDTIKPYRVASHKIWTVEPGERRNILKLDWNEAAIPPSPLVRQRLAECMNQEDFFHLYPATHNEALMAALSRYLNMPEENIQYYGGSDSLHEYIARVYLKEGDRVLTLWPSYDNFRLTAESTGAKMFFADLTKDFEFDEDAFILRIDTVKPRLVYICNPNNPTGTLLPESLLRSLLERYPETCFVLDEAYAEFAGASAKELVLEYSNLLITRTLSKAFGLANMRFGYLIASRGNIRTMDKIRNPKSISTLTQVAAQAAVEDFAYMQQYVDSVSQAREYFTRSINEGRLHEFIHAFESRGNFVLLRCRRPEIKELLLKFWEENNIFVRNVTQSASLECCIRVTVGTGEQMGRVLAAASLAFFG